MDDFFIDNKRSNSFDPVDHDSLLLKRNEIIFSEGKYPKGIFHIHRGLRHQMIAQDDSELFEFSTQHFDEDSHRVITGDTL